MLQFGKRTNKRDGTNQIGHIFAELIPVKRRILEADRIMLPRRPLQVVVLGRLVITEGLQFLKLWWRQHPSCGTSVTVTWKNIFRHLLLVNGRVGVMTRVSSHNFSLRNRMTRFILKVSMSKMTHNS